MSELKVGIIQMYVEKDKVKNIEKANSFVEKAVKDGAELVVLPEIFLCHYNKSSIHIYAEKEGELSYLLLSEIAKKNNVYLVAGSVPEKGEN
ncbi:nitrilase-related carbon-nitrogen hydrolase, partial [Lactococcus sp.]|uniref:nitrilase-related carbon-nitrogen hydrolase n=1 Tax=Lactococcus sp. TaxID=44273 RepID=UPI002FC860AE